MHRRSIALLFLGVAACSHHAPVDSRDVATRDISASVTVTHVDDGTPRNRVEATLTGPGGSVVLAAADRLQITVGGATVPLSPAPGPYGDVHRADVPDVGGDYLLDLLRGGERDDDVDVVGAVVVVPPPFTLTAPKSDVSRRTAQLVLTWDAAVGDFETSIAIAGPCLIGIDRQLSNDTGTYVINAAELADAPGKPATACDATITMVRDATKQGRLVAGGGFLSTQARSTRTAIFRSVP